MSSISAGFGSSVLMGAVMPRLLVWTLLGVGCHEVIFAADYVKLCESASYFLPLDSFLLPHSLLFDFALKPFLCCTMLTSLIPNHYFFLKKSSSALLHTEMCPEIAFLTFYSFEPFFSISLVQPISRWRLCNHQGIVDSETRKAYQSINPQTVQGSMQQSQRAGPEETSSPIVFAQESRNVSDGENVLTCMQSLHCKHVLIIL